MKALLLLPHHLSLNISSLQHIDMHQDKVFMVEVLDKHFDVKAHKKKLVFQFASMRHFASTLIDKGFDVVYKKYDQLKKEEKNDFVLALTDLIKTYKISQLIYTEGSSYKQEQAIQSLKNKVDHLQLMLCDDDLFLASRDDFSNWAKGKKKSYHGVFLSLYAQKA